MPPSLGRGRVNNNNNRSHFQRTQSKERWGQGWNERYRSLREREEWGYEEGQERGKSENRRPILRKLCAALLRSFMGQHSDKMKGSAWGNWDPREDQQPFRPNPNGVGDHTTTLRWLLIGAGSCDFLLQFVINNCKPDGERNYDSLSKVVV